MTYSTCKGVSTGRWILLYFALIASLLIILFTRYSKVRFIIYEGLRVEITFTLFTLDLSDFGGGEKRSRAPFSFYRGVVSTVIELIERSEVMLERLAVPRDAESLPERAVYTSPYKYHIVISALIAYIEAKAKKLNIRDNAVILIPDGDEELSLILTVRSRLYQVARAVARIWYLHIKSRRLVKSK